MLLPCIFPLSIEATDILLVSSFMGVLAEIIGRKLSYDEDMAPLYVLNRLSVPSIMLD
jgi:hypothetical protein